MGLKLTKRKGFNFFRSYYDVYNELESNEDKVAFIDALLDRQFLGIKPLKLKGMAKFAYISQTNSIDSQVKGFEDKTGIKLTTNIGGSDTPTVGGYVGGSDTPTVQVEVEVEVKEKEQLVVIGEKTPKLPKSNFEFRKNKFYKDVGVFVNQYSKEFLRSFFDYWTESNSSKSKMRWEMQKTFDINLRLKNWSKNEKQFNKKPEPNKKLNL